MRNSILGSAVLCVLAAAIASQAFAFQNEYGDGANGTASATFTDPDEQFDEMADRAGTGSVVVYNFGGSSGSSSIQQPSASVANHSVPWTKERIRLVFGPEAQ